MAHVSFSNVFSIFLKGILSDFNHKGTGNLKARSSENRRATRQLRNAPHCTNSGVSRSGRYA